MAAQVVNPLSRHTPAVVQASRDIKQWVRDALALDEEATVFVNELSCSVPGCPPRETVVVVMRPGLEPLQVSVHEAMMDVTPAKLRDSIAALSNAGSVAIR